MSEETEPKTAKRKRFEEGMAIGRSLGVLKRHDRTIFDQLREEALRSGMSELDIVKSALSSYFSQRDVLLKEMSVAELYASWGLLREMMEYSSKMFFGFSKIFFSGAMQAYAETISEMAKRQAGKPAKLPKKFEERFMEALEPMWTILETYMQNVMSQLFKVPVPTTQQQIPVEVVMEEEREGEEEEGEEQEGVFSEAEEPKPTE